MIRKTLFPVIVVLISFLGSKAQILLDPIVDSIPMRDTTELAADIYIPDTASANTYSTILIKTPYNRQMYRLGLPFVGYGIDTSRYVYVIVDWRCFYGSLSACSGSSILGEDGYDVVEWIASQPWSNGKVCMWGPSALGKVQYETAREKPPHLVCICPLVSATQYDYQFYYPGGVRKSAYLEQLGQLGYVTSFYYANPVYNLVWQFAESYSWYPNEIEVPVFMIGGWYDHAVEGMLELYSGLKTQSPVSVRDHHKILMGPWVHGGAGPAYVGSVGQGELAYPAAAGKSDELAMRFFDFYLENISNGWDQQDDYMYFQMGDDVWMNSNVWPPTGLQNVKLYLREVGGLDVNRGIGSDSLVFDPPDPSPTVGGPTLHSTLLQGPFDQAPLVESRNDILIYTSPVLSHDVVMKGKPKVVLWVSSDRTDTDFAIRLTDVYPDGRSMLLMDGVRRMRFRNGFSANDTSAIVPGQVYQIEIDLQTTCITFKQGHRIRLDITSSNSIRFDVNPNSGGPLYTPGDTLVATNVVYHDSLNASYIELPLESYPAGIEETVMEMGLLIYPNPAHTNMHVFAFADCKNIRLFSFDGRQVAVYDYNVDGLIIDTRSIANGLYFLIAETAHGRITRKIIFH